MCRRLSIGDQNGYYMSDDISLLDCCCFVFRLNAPHSRCSDQQDIFCRLLTLTGRSLCGFSVYTMAYMSRALAFIYSDRRVHLNVFCEVQQEIGCDRQDGGFKRRERRR